MTDMHPFTPTLEQACGGVALRHICRHMWHNWSCPVMFRDWVNSGDMNTHPGVLLSVLRSPVTPGESHRPWENALNHFAWITFYHCYHPDMGPPLAALFQEAKVRKHPDITLMIVKECKFPDLGVWIDWEAEMLKSLPMERHYDT